MIIFDLDGTLADCERRKHFVDPSKNPDFELRKHPILHECMNNLFPEKQYVLKGCTYKDCVKENFTTFKPDWKSFYEDCDKDTIIKPVVNTYQNLWIQNDYYNRFEIWSGRCESARHKTERWLETWDIRYFELKMRPIGDSTPEDDLKEKWLDEALEKGEKIEFVFDDCPKVSRMWRRRGIFVFNCCQHNEEFS